MLFLDLESSSRRRSIPRVPFDPAKTQKVIDAITRLSKEQQDILKSFLKSQGITKSQFVNNCSPAIADNTLDQSLQILISIIISQSSNLSSN